MPGREPESAAKRPLPRATPSSPPAPILAALTLANELRNDREGSHYAITRRSTALFDLALNGFAPEMSVDNLGRPTVIWRRDGTSPFVWFCGIDVADWSHPLE